MEALASRQSQTLCAAAHSISRRRGGRISPIGASRCGPRVAGLILAELPEGIAGADAPAAMHALLDGGGDALGGDQQRRQARRQSLGLAPRRLAGSPPTGSQPLW